MRLDLYLVVKEICSSRNKARNIIDQSRVLLNGKIVTKSSAEISGKDNVEILPCEQTEFVGRGGYKLEQALNEFKIDVKGKVCVDIGASTGGFTECLLLNGANKIFAVDSGKGQLAKTLLSDQRVVNIEGFNARFLTSEHLDNIKAEIVTMDVSFISQKLLYPAIYQITKNGADIITLIKPQFEAGKSALNKHGVVKDEKIRLRVVNDIIEFAKQSGFQYVAHSQSKTVGTTGNIEFLLHLKK